MVSKNYRDLIAWQKSIELVEEVYKLTREFPREEIYSLTTQMRRAAISIPSNIAEGEGRRSGNEFSHFLSIAHGSLRELETQILIAQRLLYLTDAQVQTLFSMTEEIGRLINGLANSLKRRSKT